MTLLPKAVRKCRVCGKQYEACVPPFMDVDPYRWQDVACCVEHGMEYFEMIEASRASNTTQNNDTQNDDASLENDAADKKKGRKK